MDFDKYKNKENYTKRPVKPVKTSCKTPTDWREYADRLEEWEADLVLYKNNLKERIKRHREMENQFKIDALKEVGLEGHPNADRIYNKAWELGSSNGLEKVFYYLEEISEVVI